MILRLTGVVSEASVREGVAKATQKPYAIPYVIVKVNDFVENEVTLGDAFTQGGKPTLEPGEYVDLIIDVTRTPGGYLSARATGAWPVEELARLHAAG